jgi:hypothetical protein
MTEPNRPGSGPAFAYRAAAVALALLSIVIAIVAYSALKPDSSTVDACIQAGGSGNGCDSGGPWALGVPALILFFGIGGALTVWRRR